MVAKPPKGKEVALPIARSASAPVRAAAHVARNVMLGWANHGSGWLGNYSPPWFDQPSITFRATWAAAMTGGEAERAIGSATSFLFGGLATTLPLPSSQNLRLKQQAR